MRRLSALFFLVVMLLGAPVHAVQPDEVLPDAAMEQRARAISGGLRCLVCQNESIDDSDAPLARDLRILVRDRLEAGDSDTMVKDFIVARYGEFVLLRPVFGLHTLLLWLGPVLLLAAGAFAVFRAARRPAQVSELSAEEKTRLETLLDGDK